MKTPFIKWLALAAVAPLMVACGATAEKKPEPPKEVIVTKIKREVVAPPDYLLKDCVIDTPPDPHEYSKANARTKEALLVKHAGRQALNLGKCNADKKALRDWKAKESKE